MLLMMVMMMVFSDVPSDHETALVKEMNVNQVTVSLGRVGDVNCD